jgi:hypothetical protein
MRKDGQYCRGLPNGIMKRRRTVVEMEVTMEVRWNRTLGMYSGMKKRRKKKKRRKWCRRMPRR